MAGKRAKWNLCGAEAIEIDLEPVKLWEEDRLCRLREIRKFRQHVREQESLEVLEDLRK